MTEQNLQSIQDALRAQLQALRDYVPPSTGGVIKTKNKIFTMPDETIIRGKGDQPAELFAVILDWIYQNRWDKTAYKEGVITTPSCMAFSRHPTGLIPIKDRTKTELEKHTDCDSCPMNQWESHRSGGKGKDCKNSVLLAIVPADATPGTTPWLLRVSPTGLKGFTNYVNRLASTKGLLPLQVQTRISFKPTVDYPTLVFDNDQPHDNLEVMMQLKQAASALLEENLQA